MKHMRERVGIWDRIRGGEDQHQNRRSRMVRLQTRYKPRSLDGTNLKVIVSVSQKEKDRISPRGGRGEDRRQSGAVKKLCIREERQSAGGRGWS